MPIKKRRKSVIKAHDTKEIQLLRSVVGGHRLAATNNIVRRYRIESAAKALSTELKHKKRREIARVSLKLAEHKSLSKLDKKRVKEYGIQYRPPRDHIRYEPETVPFGVKPKWYYRLENGIFGTKKIPARVVPGLIAREKELRAKDNLQRILGVSAKEADAIISRTEKQVREEYEKFKRTKKYKMLSKAEKSKVRYDRWRRWTLAGISLVLGDDYE